MIVNTALVPVPVEIKARYNNDGAVDILIGEWVYVKINYDYRYTSNAHRTVLAQKIISILKGETNP